MAVGFGLALRLKPDPREIAQALHGEATRTMQAPGDRLGPAEGGNRRSGGPPALLAVLACWAGMVTVMSLVGAALIDHGREHGAVFPVLAAHFVGMFAFFAVVGPVIERIGRTRAITAGLAIIAASCIALIPVIEQIHLVALVLFAIGLGWSLSFVAATAGSPSGPRPDRARP